MILNFILIVVSIIISIIGIGYSYKLRGDIGPLVIPVLIIIIYMVVGIINPILIEFSINTYFSMQTARIIWLASVILRIVSIWIIIVFHNIILEYRNIKTIIPIFVISLIAGTVLSVILSQNVFQIVQKNNRYFYTINNPFFLIILILFDSVSIIGPWFVQIRNFPRFRTKKLGFELNTILISVSTIILAHGLFNLTQILPFWYIHIILYIIGASLVLYSVLKRPQVFIILNCKLFDFIVFHKSGILLYSYNFITGKEEDESVIKGTILIGINHILSNLSEKKKLLNLIKMPHRDILLDYNGELGYAVLLITNQKNSIIEKAMQGFMKSFAEKNREKFEKMSGLIDVSEFKETKNILDKYFEPFISKDS